MNTNLTFTLPSFRSA